MITENFSKYIQKLFGMDATTVTLCEELIKVKKVPKGRVLIRSGEINRDLYFVEEGLLKQFFVDKNGKEHILYFAPENWLLGDRNSSYFNQPSDFSIETIEDSTIVILDPDFFVNLGKKYTEAVLDNDLLLHRHIRGLQKRVSQLLGATAEERYLDFIGTYPNLMMRVPQWMIASYLGITPESLSRVRRELAKKNFLPG